MSTFRARPGPSLLEALISTKRIGNSAAKACWLERQHVAAKEPTIDAIAMLLDQELDVGSARAGRRLEGGASRGAAS
jgi:hypothetical protein